MVRDIVNRNTHVSFILTQKVKNGIKGGHIHLFNKEACEVIYW